MPITSANSQDLVEIKEIRQNTVILKSGALRQIVMVGGVNFALKSETEQNIIITAYQNFLNGLDFSIQTVIHSRKVNIERYLGNLDKRKGEEASGLLQNQITEYQEFIRGFVKEYAIMRKIFLVVVPFSPVYLPNRKSVGAFLPFLAKKKPATTQPDPEEEAKFKEYLGQLQQRTEQVIEGLQIVGLETRALNDEELIELFYNFYNPETTEKERLTLPA